jgi:predicted alpha/beta hydrolase family esterase
MLKEMHFIQHSLGHVAVIALASECRARAKQFFAINCHIKARAPLSGLRNNELKTHDRYPATIAAR